MTLERCLGRGNHVFVCDDCGEVKNSGTRLFLDAVENIKHEGWAIVKDGDEFTHHCTDCTEEWLAQQRAERRSRRSYSSDSWHGPR